jgi:hypothetical protein
VTALRLLVLAVLPLTSGNAFASAPSAPPTVAPSAPTTDAPSAPPAYPSEKCSAFGALQTTIQTERDMVWKEQKLVSRTQESIDVTFQTWDVEGGPDAAVMRERCREKAAKFCEANGAKPQDCRFVVHETVPSPGWDAATSILAPPPTPEKVVKGKKRKKAKADAPPRPAKAKKPKADKGAKP